MKKIIFVLLIFGLILLFTSCVNNKSANNNVVDDSTTPYTSNDIKSIETTIYPREISVEDFMEKVSGHWAYARHNGHNYTCELLTFFDESQMSTGVFHGCLDRTPTITNVIQESETTYTLDLYYPRLEDPEGFWGSEEGFLPEKTASCTVSTTDDFKSNLTLNNNTYSFAGYSDSQMEKYCRNLIEESENGSKTNNSYNDSKSNNSKSSNYDNRVKKGMSKSTVESLWGAPVQTSVKVFSDGELTYCWYYDANDNYRWVVYNYNGIVASVF